MKARQDRNLTVTAVAVVVFSAAMLGWSQSGPSRVSPLGRLPDARSQSEAETTEESSQNLGDRRVRSLNVERHKSMVSDTDKLLKLARQLDAEIASNSTDELTPEEMRKVEEIEKLAHNVKAKMAQSFGGSPVFHELAIPLGGPGRQ